MSAREPTWIRDMPLADYDVARLRVPPHSVEAEQSVLGGLLIDNLAWDRAGDLLTDSDFYRHEHRLIYAAIGALVTQSRPADVITVFQHLQSIDKLAEAGGMKYLNQLAQSVPSAANMRRYAEIVRERSVLRKLIAASDEIATSAFNTQGRDVSQILDAAGASLSSVLEVGAETEDWQALDGLVVKQIDAIQDHFEQPESADHFIPTGLDYLDDLLDGGLRGGNLVIVGARPSMGKTALADAIATYVALHLGLPVGKFSMEMQNSENAQRLLALVGKIPLHALRHPKRLSQEHWERMTSAAERIHKAPLYSVDRGGLNVLQIRTRARRLKRQHGLRLLVVDYLQLMSGVDPRMPRHLQLEEASRGLKSLAKELDVPIIALAQVNRGVEKESDPMPRMSDLKDCGSLEQDADIIFFLHRHWVHKAGCDEEWKEYALGRLAKQRGGRTGDVNLRYEGQFTKFSSWPEDVPVPTSQSVTKGGGKPL